MKEIIGIWNLPRNFEIEFSKKLKIIKWTSHVEQCPTQEQDEPCHHLGGPEIKTSHFEHEETN